MPQKFLIFFQELKSKISYYLEIVGDFRANKTIIKLLVVVVVAAVGRGVLISRNRWIFQSKCGLLIPFNVNI